MFGLSIFNDAGALQLSAESQYLAEHESANFTFGSGVYSSNITFGTSIISTYPPLIFVRIISASQNETASYIARVLGSPGNWTGFNLRSGNTTQSVTGEWIAATYQPVPSSNDFGMRIYNGSGQLLFDLTRPVLKYSRVASSWTYTGNPGGGVVYTYSSGITVQTDEFVMVNQALRSHVSAGEKLSFTAITFRPNGILGLTVNTPGSGPKTSWGYFAIPLCKRA